MAQQSLFLKVAPGLFVFLWSTGFVATIYGLAHAEPLTFLAYRFGIVVVLLAGFAFVTRAPWPKTTELIGQNALVGILMHGCYLGGVYLALSRGMPAGISALIIGLQPAITAMVAQPLLGERVNRIQWLGIALGFVGMMLVVWNKAVAQGAAGWVPDTWALVFMAVSLCGITSASIYQKAKLPDQDIRTGTTWQYIGATIFVTVLAFAFEDGRVEWAPEVIYSMLWLVLVLSVGAVPLFMFIIRHGDVSKVASLLYLVPAVTAVIAWLLLGEVLNMVQIAGMAVTTFGVALVNRKTPA